MRETRFVLFVMLLLLSCLSGTTATRAESGVANAPSAATNAAASDPNGREVEGHKVEDARVAFAQIKLPAELPLQAGTISIGTANCGCIAGAKQLPLDGSNWQVMHISRNRYWGHPQMIDYIQKLAPSAAKVGWTGLLVGDMGMPRGGPMPSGHASHQRGTDVDIWLTKAPDHKLSNEVRESLSAGSVLLADSVELDPAIWTPAHANFVKEAAQDERVARIFVTPAIKKFMCSCKKADGSDTEWLRRLRPWEGHDDHIHVRLKCPAGDPCVEQDPPPEGDGCGDELSDWLQKIAKDPPFKSHLHEEKSEYTPFPLTKMPAKCLELLNAR